MSDGTEGSRRLRQSSAAAIGFVAVVVAVAWLVGASPDRLGAEVPANSAPTSKLTLAARGHRSTDLTALAQCSACHTPTVVEGGQLALAAARSPAADPADSDRLVRWGGDVYLTACADCHAAGARAHDRWRGQRVAAQEAGPQAAPVDADGAAPDAPARTLRAGSTLTTSLNEAQIAALAAFLRRHSASALTPPPQSRALL